MGRMALLAVALLALGGCSFTGLNSSPLPLTKGGGDDAIEVTVYLENAVNLVPNSEVKVDDLTVGSVRRIELERWTARLTVGLEPGTVVPANAVARIGQKSLLGAEYLELTAPEESATTEALRSGDVIGVDRTTRYPETEEVLSAASLILNGGGLDKVQTISRELNRALTGRTGAARRLIPELAEFVGTLDGQRDDIMATLEQLDRIGTAIEQQDDDLRAALDDVPDGLAALDDQHENLTRALRDVNEFSGVTREFIRTAGADLDANLEALEPTLKGLADSDDGLTGALGDMTFPYPMEGVMRITKGDYVNFFATIDLRASTLTDGFLTGTALEQLLDAQPDPEPAAQVPEQLDRKQLLSFLPPLQQASPRQERGGLLNRVLGALS